MGEYPLLTFCPESLFILFSLLFIFTSLLSSPLIGRSIPLIESLNVLSVSKFLFYDVWYVVFKLFEMFLKFDVKVDP